MVSRILFVHCFIAIKPRTGFTSFILARLATSSDLKPPAWVLHDAELLPVRQAGVVLKPHNCNYDTLSTST